MLGVGGKKWLQGIYSMPRQTRALSKITVAKKILIAAHEVMFITVSIE